MCCSHFFSASETAFFSLRKVDLLSLGRSHDGRSRVVANLLARPDDLLVTVLLGNTVVNVFYASISVVVAYEIAGDDLAFVLGVELAALLLLILAGEVVPKHVALSDPVRMSLFLARPVMFFRKIASPAVVLVRRFSDTAINLFVRQPAYPEVTTREFDVILKMGEDRGVIDSDEEDFLQGVMDMREVRVSGIMTPNADLAAADINMDREDLEAFARENRHSKLPVFEGERNNMVGVIHVKDLIFSAGTDVRDIVRPVETVPENMFAVDLLAAFRKEKENFAVVIDNRGKTAGVVTLEDVMEEIVGEIEDKYD